MIRFLFSRNRRMEFNPDCTALVVYEISFCAEVRDHDWNILRGGFFFFLIGKRKENIFGESRFFFWGKLGSMYNVELQQAPTTHRD